MDHYIDLRIRPDPEFTTAQVMNILFQKLHLTLVDLKSTDIGISFPEVNEKPEDDKTQPTLGRCLRLHAATANRLQAVVQHHHMSGLGDYLETTSPKPVPVHAQYRRVLRKQSKSNPDKLLRRQMRRHAYESMEEARQIAIRAAMVNHGISEKKAVQQIDHAQKLSLPFVHLRSSSTGQDFCLFIEHGPVGANPVAGHFNSYGLSTTATVPWF
jgi:CRISPR-associated endonuclease Csy4